MSILLINTVIRYLWGLKLLSCNRLILVFCLTFFTNTIFANEQLVVAVGLAKPPYVIQEFDTGFELDLIRNLLKEMGKSTKFVYTQFGHSSKMLKVKAVDAVMTTNKSIFSDSTKLSDKYITYQNVAISLKSSQLTINTIADLANYSIASFQKADIVLGQAFADAVDQSPAYMKVAEQSRQPKLLLKKRVEVLVMDKNIFSYFARAQGIKDIQASFIFHPIFPETHYRMAFKNQKYVDDFNEAFAKYKLTNEYLALKNRYNL